MTGDAPTEADAQTEAAVDDAPAPRSAARPPAFPALTVAIVASLAVGFILLLEVFVAPPAPWGGADNPGGFGPPQSRAEHLVAKMDGHTFAEIALDPNMVNTPDAYFGDRENAAYRSSRPMQGWLAFVASAGGQRPLLAPALLALTAATVGAAILSVAALARVAGRRVRYLGAVLATPAFIAAVAYPGICEPLAIALSCAGIAAWLRKQPWLAVGLLTAAGLTRETMLVVPLGLGITHLLQRRTPLGALKLALPAVAYGVWITLVHDRLGAWPSDYSQTAPPLEGFRMAFPHWHAAEWAAAALLVASAAVIATRGTTWMRVIALLHVPILVAANHQVWWVWLGFGRVTMLLPIFALIVLGTPLADERREQASEAVDGEAPAETDVGGLAVRQ
ncbi:MAG: hypothetical protein R2746_12435 [Acidimicrobiales bacterium]